MQDQFRKDKVIVVTGSSKGLGKKTAITLAKKGAKVIINGRNKKTLQQVTNEFEQEENLQIIAMQADVTQAHECQDLIESIIKTHKKLDCIINNVGFMARGSLEFSTNEMIQTSINTNLLASIYCTKYAIPYLKETQGSIIFVSSLGGIRGIPNIASYCVAKMGLKALRQSLESELQKHNVHCGIIYPGYIKGYEHKTIQTNTGETIPAPNTSRHEPKQIAQKIANMIKHRRKSHIIGRRSKGFALLQILAPNLLARLIQKMTPQINAQNTKDIELTDQD